MKYSVKEVAVSSVGQYLFDEIRAILDLDPSHINTRSLEEVRNSLRKIAMNSLQTKN